MPNIQFTNFAATTLASGINGVVTSLTVATGTGALFPTLVGAQYFYCVLADAATGTTREVIKVTARSTDTFTITRAQDGTTGQTYITGDKVELRLTAAGLATLATTETAQTFTGVQTFTAPVLGTPTSGTVTNLTGTASININGTVGATTPAAGAFTTLSATGITTVAAGSAALPAIVSTTGTADTGLWFPAADTVAASTAGTEQLRIDSSGNVGIGTTSPSTYGKLAVSVGNNSFMGATTSSGSSGGAGGWQLNSYYGSVKINYIDCELTNGTAASEASVMRFATIGSGTLAERMRIDSSGNLLLNQTSGNADAKFSVNAGSTDASPCIDFRKGSATTTTAQVFTRFFTSAGAVATGSITANGVSAATFTAYSDKRLKENIVDLPSQLSNIMALRPVEFDFKGYEPGEGHQIGFIAQEVQEIYPDLVGEGADGMLTLSDMNKNDARLIKCIQEQQALITALTARITVLENK